MSRVIKILDNSKKSASKRVDDLTVRRFLNDLLRKNLSKHSTNEYNYDSIDDMGPLQ